MDNQKRTIEEMILQIKKDIKKDVLDKYGLDDYHIAAISFKTSKECLDGYEYVCKDYGKDPDTGKPIIVCKCVPKNPPHRNRL